MLTFERANELFKYEPETGMLIRKVTTGNNRFHAGTVAGCASPEGYLRVRIDKALYRVHRVCYLLAYGSLADDMQVDHINHDRADNRLANLRLVTNTQNGRNTKLPVTNTTGVIGVSYNKKYDKYYAHIHIKGKNIYLGQYDTLEEAAAARADANLKYGFHSNHGLNKSRYVRKR